MKIYVMKYISTITYIYIKEVISIRKIKCWWKNRIVNNLHEANIV